MSAKESDSALEHECDGPVGRYCSIEVGAELRE